jgi:hypothetical protein
LLLVLVAVGCERSPNGNSATEPAPPSGAIEGKRAPATADPPGTQVTVSTTQPTATSQAADAQRQFVAYYFHRTVRCQTCLSIEKQSREAIELGYNGELSAGRLEWHAVNIEEPGNEHFEQDFELQTQSLVLAEMAGERATRWKLLPKVWELVEDPYGFQEYVVAEVALFLGGG